MRLLVVAQLLVHVVNTLLLVVHTKPPYRTLKAVLGLGQILSMLAEQKDPRFLFLTMGLFVAEFVAAIVLHALKHPVPVPLAKVQPYVHIPLSVRAQYVTLILFTVGMGAFKWKTL